MVVKLKTAVVLVSCYKWLADKKNSCCVISAVLHGCLSEIEPDIASDIFIRLIECSEASEAQRKKMLCLLYVFINNVCLPLNCHKRQANSRIFKNEFTIYSVNA